MLAAIAAKYKIILDENDPAFILVDLNQIALKETTDNILLGYSGLLKDIESRADKVLDDIESAAWAASDLASQKAKAKIELELGEVAKRVAESVCNAAESQMQSRAAFGRAAVSVALIFSAVASFLSGGYFFNSQGGALTATASGNAIPAPSAQEDAARRLSSLGDAVDLLGCSKPGWKVKDGFCFPAPPSEGVISGWRVR